MRLDLFLKRVRIVKRRQVAKELIEKGMVLIEGEKVRPSKIVREGMDITVRNTTYRITKIPDREIERNEGERYYKVLNDWDNSG